MYFVAALVLLVIIFGARAMNKWGVPLVIIALFAGILFGSDVLNLVSFDNYKLAQNIANFALVFVLFTGGFVTKKERLRLVRGPALVLATAGVMITALVIAGLLYTLLHYSLSKAILISCIIASTDAAAVFSILRSKSLKPELSAVVEIESATNDPMAIVLTTVAVNLVVAHTLSPLDIGLSLLWQIAGGVAIGLLIGKAGTYFGKYITDLDKGYFYLYLIALIMLSYGVADEVRASGIMSAFFAGYVMGNSKNLPYKSTSSTLLDALSSIGNVVIFVLLGLLVFPREFRYTYWDGIVLFLILAFVARPIALTICTFFAKPKYSIKEKIFLNWSGLRGAVPIVLATYPAAKGIEGSGAIFNIVFIAVLLSMVIQGSTIAKLSSLLKLSTKAKPRPKQVMELVAMQNSELELIEIVVDDDTYYGTAAVWLFNLPPQTAITMVNRHDTIIAPTGTTEIEAGDVLYVLTKTSEIDNVQSEIMKHFKSKK